MTKIGLQIVRALEAEEFCDSDVSNALEACQKEHEAQFMPAIFDARIAYPNNAAIWSKWFSAPSIRATGKTSQGNSVVVYAHIPNYLSNPKNIREAIGKGLRNMAGIMPQAEFQRLVDLDGSTDNLENRSVWVVDYDTLRKSKSGGISVYDALEHPQTIPFIGGKDRAERYLLRHKKVNGKNIGNWHSNDLQEDGSAVGRLLFIGLDGDCVGLLGNCSLNGYGRFVGHVRVP